jgi:hypothetical protein
MGGDGGAISYASTGIINIDQCSFINNTAYNYSGGGYFVGSGGAVSIAYYTYANATAPVTGSTSITNCSFTGNSSFEQGGAIYIYAEKKITLPALIQSFKIIFLRAILLRAGILIPGMEELFLLVRIFRQRSIIIISAIIQ